MYDGQLAAGQSIQLIQTVTINRAGVTNGSYYLSVLADATNNLAEVTKTNNVGVSASNILVQVTPLPMLNVAAVDSPATAIDGQPVGSKLGSLQRRAGGYGCADLARPPLFVQHHQFEWSGSGPWRV